MLLKSFSQSLINNLKPVNRAIVNTTSVRQYATQNKVIHPPRRTYLHNMYENIIQKNRAVFIFQHNNLNVKEFTKLRQELGQLEGGNLSKLTVLRTGVFTATLRQTQYVNMEALISGPTCVLTINNSDSEHPLLMKKAIELLSKNKKLLLLGGKLDDVLLTQNDVLKVVDLPSIDQLRAQVVGTIEAPARKLISTLAQPSTELHSVLDRRI
ncbi:hypothetical protein BDB01DRAFT_843332 [Pilobolus umbonatus]|nr:hypothetical protein BDB01DRAFT_843332 [Pilobolus umbonatus]